MKKLILESVIDMINYVTLIDIETYFYVALLIIEIQRNLWNVSVAAYNSDLCRHQAYYLLKIVISDEEN